MLWSVDLLLTFPKNESVPCVLVVGAAGAAAVVSFLRFFVLGLFSTAASGPTATAAFDFMLFLGAAVAEAEVDLLFLFLGAAGAAIPPKSVAWTVAGRFCVVVTAAATSSASERGRLQMEHFLAPSTGFR